MDRYFVQLYNNYFFIAPYIITSLMDLIASENGFNASVHTKK